MALASYPILDKILALWKEIYHFKFISNKLNPENKIKPLSRGPAWNWSDSYMYVQYTLLNKFSLVQNVYDLDLMEYH